MRALFIQHDPFSPTGPVGEAFADLGYEISEFVVVPHADFHSPNVVAEWPNFSDYDLLVPMGSPWGAWDEAKIGSWLLPELALLKAAHESDIPIFGICFGGQLMARALGGSVAPGPRPEIGWFPVHSDRPDLIAEGPWFQFHYDRWTLPPNIKEIARTPVASQGFVSERTLGIQFHPEVVTSTLRGWIDNGGESAVAGDGQSIEALINMTRAQEVAAIGRAHTLVKNFVSQVVMA